MKKLWGEGLSEKRKTFRPQKKGKVHRPRGKRKSPSRRRRVQNAFDARRKKYGLSKKGEQENLSGRHVMENDPLAQKKRIRGEGEEGGGGQSTLLPYCTYQKRRRRPEGGESSGADLEGGKKEERRKWNALARRYARRDEGSISRQKEKGIQSSGEKGEKKKERRGSPDIVPLLPSLGQRKILICPTGGVSHPMLLIEGEGKWGIVARKAERFAKKGG